MATYSMPTKFGEILYYWRKTHRMSQMELALAADVSLRHLSFVETGRSQPSERLVLRLAQALNLSFRHSNAMLVSAGYAPKYQTLALSDEKMKSIENALSRFLTKHEPFPAVVIDRAYNILLSNQGFRRLMTWLTGGAVLQKYQNVYQIAFATDGLQPYFLNWDNVKYLMLNRLHEEAMMYQDQRLWELYETCEGRRSKGTHRQAIDLEQAELPVLSFSLQKEHHTLSFFSALTTFGTALDVTGQELRIENLFPADKETEHALKKLSVGTL